MSSRMSSALIVAAALAAGSAQAFNDPDWPCEQRKVVNLSIGQMWPGPIPEDMDAWREDDQLRDAVGRIAARRTPMEDVEEIVARVAESAAEGRQERLTALFAGVFTSIDQQRAQIVDGIVRYVLKQRALSEKIDADQVALARLEADVAEDDYDTLDRIDEMRDAILWDVRIYEERRRSLTYVCESPVLLERRAFAVGRMIAERLGD